MFLKCSLVLLFYNAIPKFTSAILTPDDDFDFERVDPSSHLLQTVNDIVRENNELIDHIQINSRKRRTLQSELDNWTGRWFPENDSINRMNSWDRMPKIIPGCDDGKTNLTIDWDNSEWDYTCSMRAIEPNYHIHPLKYCEYIPKEYKAAHLCMDDTIEYSDSIPVYGTHRPVWPVYGTYKFLPKQRWLHSLEHGGVVMLYHPCANEEEIEILEKLVKSCLRRHIITPYDSLSEQRPLALVTWGCRLTMSYVDAEIVKTFIREHALRGPESIPEDGLFEEGLIEKPEISSTESILDLCL